MCMLPHMIPDLFRSWVPVGPMAILCSVLRPYRMEIWTDYTTMESDMIIVRAETGGGWPGAPIPVPDVKIPGVGRGGVGMDRRLVHEQSNFEGQI